MTIFVAGYASDAAAGGPQVFLSEGIYEFQPVVEGTHVVHDFILQNRGDETLEIVKIESGWGCTAVSSIQQIPPGQEGNIQVTVSTGGYGGRKIRESVYIHTNDPNRRKFGITVTGIVEKFAEIRPERVRLAGPAGQELFADVEIIPRKDYPFIIGDIKAKNGEFIKYEVVKSCIDGDAGCTVRVENTRKEKGRYVDVLYVNTGSKLKPTIPIYITGIIQ